MSEKCPIRKRNDAEGRKFWECAERASKKIESWPEWKRKVKVTQFSLSDELNHKRI